MTRRVLAYLPLLTLTACLGEPTSSPSDPTGIPTFVISDASHSGRPDFGWRPPIANTTLTGTFDGTRNPTVRICVLNAALNGCSGADIFTRTSVPVVASSYQVDWTVPVSSVTYYRIIVQAGSPAVILGLADVKTAATTKQLKGTDPNQYVAITDGSILPIKFRISSACATATCGGGFIDPTTGGTAYYVKNGETIGGIHIPPQGSGGDTKLITVAFSDCPSGELAIDNPKFGSCISVFASDADGEIEGSNRLTVAGEAFVCDAPAAADVLSAEQEELVTLHRKHAAELVQALPHADDQCPAPPVSLGARFRGLIRALAHGEWNKAGDRLFGLLAPKPVYARRLDAGAGGQTDQFSLFQFALPATMECIGGCSQFGTGGSQLPDSLVVLVTDFNGDPVQNATIHFSTGDGSVSPSLLLSDSAGLAKSAWTVPASGEPWQAIAYGVGIAADNKNGPRQGDCAPSGDCQSDPFQPIQDHFDGCGVSCPPLAPVSLDTGVVIFDATTGCGIDCIGAPSFLKAAERSGGSPQSKLAVPAKALAPKRIQ